MLPAVSQTELVYRGV